MFPNIDTKVHRQQDRHYTANNETRLLPFEEIFKYFFKIKFYPYLRF